MAQKRTILLARELRKATTEAENKLWKYLRGRKFNQLKFLRQHPIIYGGNTAREDFFIADFYCHEKKLVIELDGGIHKEQKQYDEGRDQVLNELGIYVLRMENSIMETPDQALEKIKEFIRSKGL
ncbi:hypothetical protein GCM10011506_14770 [Marivirga lumbricoides]|uniref:DUF559 domain-containing protein n=1 Tax=Marivirga lumbricoides TaxID=1046115 RepID=A0ABQ1LV32_9BACT|nr:hypothetical protein GCM10011506_14770 [Marivirga lumbricoides]